MKEELTTAMHAELMEAEMSREDLNVWAVYGAMARGLTKKEACARYGFAVEDWEREFARVRATPVSTS